MFGIFFDSAVRHDSQRLASTRAGESIGITNLLHNAFRGGGIVIYDYVRDDVYDTDNRSRISFAAWHYDFGVSGSFDCRE